MQILLSWIACRPQVFTASAVASFWGVERGWTIVTIEPLKSVTVGICRCGTTGEESEGEEAVHVTVIQGRSNFRPGLD